MTASTKSSVPLPASTSTPGGVPRAPAPPPPPPLPVRTFPLPNFYPFNPLSWVHLGYVWLTHVIYSPREPSSFYEAIWSPKGRCIRVTDAQSKRALWEEGFFGKGQFSRSEPNHHKRNLARAGAHSGFVAEEHTVKRREERNQLKWDRARKEQEAIHKVKLDEAWMAPVGPKELLALPNSLGDIHRFGPSDTITEPSDESVLPNGHGEQLPGPPDSGTQSPLKQRHKSVRFSSQVQSATFGHSDPPSPNHGRLIGNGKVPVSVQANGSPPVPRDGGHLSTESFTLSTLTETTEGSSSTATEAPSVEIVDREDLILTREEAFFLTFGLGVLAVKDESNGKPLSVQDLFLLFRQHSYFPPRSVDLQPDDPFLIHYAVYHHFRSLGWIVRPGIKFGVEWLLYYRGPAHSHAEFAVIVIPSYEHPHWKAQGYKAPQKPWSWLTGIHRVQSRAFKTPVLVYVEIPPPGKYLDISSTLKQYKIREFVLYRWQINRNRDVRR